MTQDEMIELAKQAGWKYAHGESGFEPLWDFANLVAAKAFQSGYEKGVAVFDEAVWLEREACAKVCDEFNFGQAAMMIQRAIRARGEA